MTLTPAQNRQFKAYKAQLLKTITWENLLARMLDFDKEDEDLILGYLRNGFGGRAGKEILKSLRVVLANQATLTFQPKDES